MRQAMIFAAGLGMRLKPLTDTMPKALVRVGGSPLLEHVILKLKYAGVGRIVVNVYHFAEQITGFLAANGNYGLDIHVSDESAMLLETGGGIRKAVPLFLPDAPVLIHNVDILSNVDLQDFYDSNPDNGATLLVSNRKTRRYLLFDDDMELKGWTDVETGEVRRRGERCRLKTMRTHRPSLQKEGDGGGASLFAFSGIHLFSPRLFPLFAGWPERFGIMDFYLGAPVGVSIKGYVKDGLRLVDVGKLDTLEDAEDFLVKSCPPLRFL